jgi:predicted lipoprotein with Yx(FWY)xxD motif
MFSRSQGLLLVAAALALGAAACGSTKTPTTAAAGGSGATTTTAAPASTTTTTAPAATTTAPAAATVATRTTGIGMVLVDSAGKTLYHFDKDTSTAFGCTGACTTAWPPLTVPSGTTMPVGGTGVTGTLAVRARPDGSQQVTWNGLPLYRFAADAAPGDTKGDGLGGNWHAAKPGASTTATTATPGYGGSY